ncbi:hypothetical protein D3C78_1890360 [compost metagenome]
MRPSRLMESAASKRKHTSTLGRFRRSPSHPPAMAPNTAPRFSATRKDRLEPRL